MTSKRSHEGYILIDNKVNEGVTDEAMVKAGFPVGSGKGVFEAPTYTCSHCQRIVIINPLRNRERAYCRKCDHYICDGCGQIMAATKECKPFKQILDEQQEATEKSLIIAK